MLPFPANLQAQVRARFRHDPAVPSGPRHDQLAATIAATFAWRPQTPSRCYYQSLRLPDMAHPGAMAPTWPGRPAGPGGHQTIRLRPDQPLIPNKATILVVKCERLLFHAASGVTCSAGYSQVLAV
jgi:hypothetical protein